MNAIWLLILTLFYLPAEASWQDYFPSESSLEKARNWILEHTDQSTHLHLFTHLPKLFPVPFICRLQAGGSTRIVIPYEPPRFIEAGDELNCPGFLRLRAVSKASVAVSRTESRDVLQVETGNVDIFPSQPGFILRSAGNDLLVTQITGKALIKLRVKENDTLVYTEQGALELLVSLSSESNKNRLFLGSIYGRVAVKSRYINGVKYIFPGLAYAAADMALPVRLLNTVSRENLWEKFGIKQQIEEFNYPLTIAYPAAHPSPPQPIQMLLLVPGNLKTCTLFTRSGENGEFVKAYEFPVTSSVPRFILKLHSDYLKYALNLACSDDHGNIVYSNELISPPQ